MITIAQCLVNDYISRSKLKNFCAAHNMPVSENKPELLKQIIEYAGNNKEDYNYQETYNWFLNTIKSGSKDFCLKRVYFPEDSIENMEQILEEKYGQCSMEDILSFKHTENFLLVNYKIEKNEQGIVSKVSFIFSRLVLEGDKEFEKGHRIIYPVYIDMYIDEGFIVGRYKPKTIIYKFSENDIIYRQNRFKPFDECTGLIQQLEILLKTESMDINPGQRFRQMMYKMYQKYSFTPIDIQNQIDYMKEQRDAFVDKVFDMLELNIVNN